MDRRPTCTKAITGEAGDIHDAYAHDIRTRARAADVVTTHWGCLWTESAWPLSSSEGDVDCREPVLELLGSG